MRTKNERRISSQTGHSVPSSRSYNISEQTSTPHLRPGYRPVTQIGHDIERSTWFGEIREIQTIFRESQIFR